MIKKAKGLIALDIDGTITTDMQPISQKVIKYFVDLHARGWVFVFITGRTFDFGYRVLKDLPFNYFYAVQNGAILFSMPDQKILSKKYLDRSIFPSMEKICVNEATDFVIYAGFEMKNHCFFRKKHFSEQMLSYLKERQAAFHEEWIDIVSFYDLPVNEFPSIKCFGDRDSAVRIANNIENILHLHVPVIKDPFCADYYVIQATHPAVSKGQALRDLMRLSNFDERIIAAGDDLNDLSLFDEADIKIAMENAPEELKKRADIIAPPASLIGIIEGLKEALNLDSAVKNAKEKK